MSGSASLLASSVALAAVAALVAGAIAFGAAAMAASRRSASTAWMRRLMVAMVAVPPYVHAMAWAPLRAGWIASAWVQSMALLPLAFCLNLLAFESLDGKLLDAARLHAAPGDAFRRIVLPLMAAPALACAGLLFALSLADYTVPSLFSTSTTALEIFTEFSGSGDPARALAVSLPLVAATAVALWLVQARLRSLAMRRTRAAFLPDLIPAWMRRFGYTAMSLAALQAAMVLASLLPGAAPANFARAVAASYREVGFGFAVAAAAALISVPIAAAAGTALAANSRPAGWLWAATLAPLALPAPLVGAGLIALCNRPAGDWVYATPAMPVLAALARFLPMAAMLAAAFERRLDPLLLDAACVYGRNRARTLLRVHLPLRAPGLAAASGVVFALALGEIGATLMVAPPGRATLTMKIYNYLHYGASESVAALCLVTALGAMAAGWTLARAVQR